MVSGHVARRPAMSASASARASLLKYPGLQTKSPCVFSFGGYLARGPGFHQFVDSFNSVVEDVGMFWN
jgi:hypothetical protein